MSIDNEIAMRRWHAKNPHVYELFKRFTFEAIRSGREVYSARTIFHRMRWHTDIETQGDRFKINDNHSPYYSRMFMRDFPAHSNFFRLRVLSEDRGWNHGDESGVSRAPIGRSPLSEQPIG